MTALDPARLLDLAFQIHRSAHEWEAEPRRSLIGKRVTEFHLRPDVLPAIGADPLCHCRAIAQELSGQAQPADPAALDPARLAAIQAREQAATKGLWWTGPYYKCDVMSSQGTIRNHPLYTSQAAADSEFIAHARSDIPYLLAVIAQLQGENDTAKIWRQLAEPVLDRVEQSELAAQAAEDRAEKAEADLSRLQAERDEALKGAKDARMGHVRLDECAGSETTRGQPLYDRISAKIQELHEANEEKRHIIAAMAHEKDELRARAGAAEHRRNAAEYRAQRIVLDAELKARAEAAEAARDEAQRAGATMLEALEDIAHATGHSPISPQQLAQRALAASTGATTP